MLKGRGLRIIRVVERSNKRCTRMKEGTERVEERERETGCDGRGG